MMGVEPEIELQQEQPLLHDVHYLLASLRATYAADVDTGMASVGVPVDANFSAIISNM